MLTRLPVVSGARFAALRRMRDGKASGPKKGMSPAEDVNGRPPK